MFVYIVDVIYSLALGRDYFFYFVSCVGYGLIVHCLRCKCAFIHTLMYMLFKSRVLLNLVVRTKLVAARFTATFKIIGLDLIIGK